MMKKYRYKFGYKYNINDFTINMENMNIFKKKVFMLLSTTISQVSAAFSSFFSSVRPIQICLLCGHGRQLPPRKSMTGRSS